MNEQDITTSELAADIDADDVEAHGIKEVMVGLSAAAVLTGGVAAVVTAGSDGAGPSTAKARVAADNLGDVADISASTSGTDTSVGSVGVLGGTGVTLGNDTVGLRPSTSAGGTAIDGDVVDADVAGQDDDITVSVRTGTLLDSTRTTVRTAPTTVSNAVDGTTRTANQAVADTTAIAQSAVNQTVKTVDQTVADVNKTLDATIVFAGDTTRGIQGTISTLTGKIMPGAEMRLDASALSGTITVTVGGNEIATADVQNGSFTVSYTAPQADLPVQVHYTSLLGSLSRVL